MALEIKIKTVIQISQMATSPKPGEPLKIYNHTLTFNKPLLQYVST
jgi:hypothetical protein